jgi:hypothetical protein
MPVGPDSEWLGYNRNRSIWLGNDGGQLPKE